MVMTSNNNLDPLEVIFGFQEECRYHYEVFCTKDGCLNPLVLVNGIKKDIRSLTKSTLAMKDHK